MQGTKQSRSLARIGGFKMKGSLREAKLQITSKIRERSTTPKETPSRLLPKTMPINNVALTYLARRRE